MTLSNDYHFSTNLARTIGRTNISISLICSKDQLPGIIMEVSLQPVMLLYNLCQPQLPMFLLLLVLPI
jgi:hypothetical protein